VLLFWGGTTMSIQKKILGEKGRKHRPVNVTKKKEKKGKNRFNKRQLLPLLRGRRRLFLTSSFMNLYTPSECVHVQVLLKLWRILKRLPSADRQIMNRQSSILSSINEIGQLNNPNNCAFIIENKRGSILLICLNVMVNTIWTFPYQSIKETFLPSTKVDFTCGNSPSAITLMR
jgi:hypothetical protein